MDLQAIKQRYGIVGFSPQLERALDIARQVAPTDLTVLITGESGVGKEVFPQIIHHLSSRKHGPYIAVNCGAIPEGTIDSELFGHEKGSFTGAHEARKGYFEVVNGGTIFLDEVGELPLATQVRLLRVLESGEFIKVGSSKVLKTDVRVVAATNIDLNEAIQRGKFRQDLYYRLNSVPISIPPLRERNDDILLLFKKFANDFAEKYRMPPIELDESARHTIQNFRWPGNVRQLKNITEQISIIEQSRLINANTLQKYLKFDQHDLPVIYNRQTQESAISERDLLYKVLFEMRRDITDLKKLVGVIVNNGGMSGELQQQFSPILNQLYREGADHHTVFAGIPENDDEGEAFAPAEEVGETLSLQKIEEEMIRKAIEKHPGNRKIAAQELGISERTLYRKLKEYGLN